jgi:ribonuclease PH
VSWLLREKRLVKSPIIEPIAAISVGKVDGRILVDLDYSEDSRAEVDCNIAMTGSGRFIEVQASAEGETFSRAELDRMLSAAGGAIRKLMAAQKAALARRRGG